jgi:flagellin-like hook-associated protein FlgL
MMSDMFLSDANNSLNRVYKYQNQVDSTKRVSRISEDPQATMVALKARNKLSNLSMYQSNIKT